MRNWFIYITILLDGMGHGLLIPVLPDVLRRFTTDPAAVSQYFGYFVGAYAFVQFLMSPILGSLSDRFGRRPILLISLLGAAIDYVIMALAPTLSVLFASRMVAGLTGASQTVAASYISDVSTDKDRAANFGMIGASMAAGLILGPLLGGLLSTFGPTAPFLAAATLNGLNFLFGLLVLPESLSVPLRRSVKLQNLNPFTSIGKLLAPSPRLYLVVVYFLLNLAGNVHPINWTLYTQLKFNWSTMQVGLSLSLVGILFGVSQGVLPRVFIPRFGESKSLLYGSIIYLVSFALFALAPTGTVMLAILVLFSFSGLAIPALQTLVTKLTPPTEQGELQGSLMALSSLGTVVAPIIYTYLFVKFTEVGGPIYFPGAAYMGAALISGLSVIVLARKRAIWIAD